MPYTRRNWQNAPSSATPLNAAALNNIEDGVEAATEAIANLPATIDSVVTTAIAGIDTGTVSTSDQVGALVRKMGLGVESPVACVLGDSTSAALTGWFNLLMAGLGDLFPNYTIERRDWSHTNQRYEPVPTVVQVGTAGVRRMVGTGSSTDKFFTIADSPATSPSGEFAVDIEMKIVSPFGTAVNFAGKVRTSDNHRSWFVGISAGGTPSFTFSPDGTSAAQLTRTANAQLPGSVIGNWITLRVKWRGDDGSGNNVTEFSYSTNNGASFTAIGTAVTTATAVATMFNGSAPTQLNGMNAGVNAGMVIEYKGMRVWTSVASGARPVIDFQTGQWNGYGSLGTSSAQFTDFVGNAVTVNGTGNTGSMQGAPVLFVFNGAVSGQTISYANDSTRRPKLIPSTPDMAVINFSHNEIGLIDYRPPYKELGDAITGVSPDVAIVATIQNRRYAPATNIDEHAIRGSRIGSLAGSEHWALVDVASILDATGDQQSFINTDGIHPTQPGYDLIAEQALRLFTTWILPQAP